LFLWCLALFWMSYCLYTSTLWAVVAFLNSWGVQYRTNMQQMLGRTNVSILEAWILAGDPWSSRFWYSHIFFLCFLRFFVFITNIHLNLNVVLNFFMSWCWFLCVNSFVACKTGWRLKSASVHEKKQQMWGRISKYWKEMLDYVSYPYSLMIDAY